MDGTTGDDLRRDGVPAVAAASAFNISISSRNRQKRRSELDNSGSSLVDAALVRECWVACCMRTDSLKHRGLVQLAIWEHIQNHVLGWLAHIRLALKIADIHVLPYSTRDLITTQVTNSEKHRKNAPCSMTPESQEGLAPYPAFPKACRLNDLRILGLQRISSQELPHFVRHTSGLNDQAARAATSL
jgi:predicted MarR family transcription regulator